jgi:hypothetical protein
VSGSHETAEPDRSPGTRYASRSPRRLSGRSYLIRRLRKATFDGKPWTCRARQPTVVSCQAAATASQRAERGSYVGCIAGALSMREYNDGLATAGFIDITITPTHPVAEGMHSATIRAVKPV